MKTVGKYLQPYIVRMILGVTIKFIGTMMDLVLPWILSYVIDTVVPSGSIAGIARYGGLMLLCAVVCVAFNVIANRMAARVSKDVIKNLRHDLFQKISRLSFSAIDRYSVSSLVSRLTNDTYNVHQMFDKLQRGGVRAPLLVLGGITVTFLIDPVLALVLLLISPLMILTVYLVTRKGVPLYRQVQSRVEGLVRTVRENASGVRVIKALSRTEHEIDRFTDVNAGVREAEKRAGTVMATSNPIIGLLLNAGLTTVILVGAYRVQAGRMQAGTIIAFLSYFTIILTATLTLTKMFVVWSKGSASAQRIEEVLQSAEELPLAVAAPLQNDAYLVFDRVSFSYNGRRDDLCDISFQLQRGQTLGIIGPTGSGKTTLLALLMRFYDPRCGAVSIGGRRVDTIPQAELSAMFGVVFQNDVLLAESIYENISFMRGVSKEQVERAARAAQAWEFIEALPDGLDTAVGIRGATLSGGQRQRLLIARALAGDPEILILDDAESALDYRTDAKLRAAIRASYPHVTLLVVSERISAIRSADRILSLTGGREEVSGTHEELMQKSAAYRKIAELQMGGQA